MQEYGILYTGNSEDGSDARRVQMYLSSCGNFWGGKVFTKHEERQLRKMEWREKIKNLK